MRVVTAVLLATVVLTSCSKCGQGGSSGPVPVERMLPRGAVSLAVVPELGALGQRLKGLENLKVAAFSAQLQGFTDAHQWADTLVGQLGVDVRSKEALELAGLDPARGAGVAAMLDGSVFLVLPMKDEPKLAAVLAKLATQRLGAGIAEQKTIGEITLHSYVTAAGSPARLGYVVAHGYALIGSDATVGKLPTFSKIPEAESLAKDAAWLAALTRLPKERDLMLVLPPGSPVLKGSISCAVAALSVQPDALRLTLDAPWIGDPKMLLALTRKPGAELLGFLPDDAWLVAKFSSDATLLAPFADRLIGPYLKRAFTEGNFDLDAEILQNLAPGAVAGLSLAPTAKMQGMPALDLRATNPFHYAHLSGVAPVKDPVRAGATLDKLVELGPKFGSRIEKTDRAGKPVYFTTYAAGEGVHFAAQGQRVFFGSPGQRIDALLAGEGKGAGPITDPALKAVLDSRALAMVIDLKKLAAAVRELPSEAWGIGGFAIKATTLRWLDATDDLKAVTVGLESKSGAVQAQLVLSLVPPAPKP